MKSGKTFFLRLVYFSALIFVIIKVYRERSFQLPEYIRYNYLTISISCILLGEFFSAFSWFKLLRKFDSSIPFLAAVNSRCKTILSKYIPGKIWTIASPAAYVSKFTHISYPSLLALSLLHQIIAIWAGILFGMVLLSRISETNNMILTYLGSLFLLSMLIIFPKYTIALPVKAYCILTKDKTEKYNMLFNEKTFQLMSIIAWYCCIWLFYTAGFYFLIKSISGSDFQILSAFAFPLASVVGIISIFTVGGLGIREGVISYILIKYEFTPELAVTISSISRLLFIAGEITVFSGSFVISRLIKHDIHSRGI